MLVGFNEARIRAMDPQGNAKIDFSKDFSEAMRSAIQGNAKIDFAKTLTGMAYKNKKGWGQISTLPAKDRQEAIKICLQKPQDSLSRLQFLRYILHEASNSQDKTKWTEDDKTCALAAARDLSIISPETEHRAGILLESDKNKREIREYKQHMANNAIENHRKFWERHGDHLPGIWRQGAPEIHMTSRTLDIVHDKGKFSKAIPATGGFHLSDVGAGAKPLLVVGTRKQVIAQLCYENVMNHKIINTTGSVAQKTGEGNHHIKGIYAGITDYAHEGRFESISPLRDAANKIAKDALGYMPISYSIESAGRAMDVASNTQTLHGIAEQYSSPEPQSSDTIRVKISHFKEDGMIKIGEDQASFDQIVNLIERGHSAQASQSHAGNSNNMYDEPVSTKLTDVTSELTRTTQHGRGV